MSCEVIKCLLLLYVGKVMESEVEASNVISFELSCIGLLDSYWGAGAQESELQGAGVGPREKDKVALLDPAETYLKDYVKLRYIIQCHV